MILMVFLPVIQFISYSMVLVALVYGAWNDIKTRTSPKWIWNLLTPFAGISTLIWYIADLDYGGVNAVLPVFLLSIILCAFSVVMGYRMGNGGDWRALFYISLLTPWITTSTITLSCILGLVQILVDKIRGSKIDSAWMISITLSFVIIGFLYFLDLIPYRFIM